MLIGHFEIIQDGDVIFSERNTILNLASASLLRACVLDETAFTIDISDGGDGKTVSPSDFRLFNESGKSTVSSVNLSLSGGHESLLTAKFLVDNSVVVDMNINEALLRVGGKPVAKKVFPTQIKTSANVINFVWRIEALLT